MSLSSKLSIRDVELKGKKVVMRLVPSLFLPCPSTRESNLSHLNSVDFNVPFDGEGNITNNQVSRLSFTRGVRGELGQILDDRWITLNSLNPLQRRSFSVREAGW